MKPTFLITSTWYRQRAVVLLDEHLAVDLQNRGGGVGQQVLHLGVDQPELDQQLAHVLGPAARGGLVGHARHPLHQVAREQAVHAHQHAAHGAVAADVVPDSPGKGVADDRQVDGIEHDDRVVFHAQRPGGVDPVAIPPRGP